MLAVASLSPSPSSSPSSMMLSTRPKAVGGRYGKRVKRSSNNIPHPANSGRRRKNLSRARLTEICARLRLSFVRLCLPLLCDPCKRTFSLFVHKLDKPLPMGLLCAVCKDRLGSSTSSDGNNTNRLTLTNTTISPTERSSTLVSPSESTEEAMKVKEEQREDSFSNNQFSDHEGTVSRIKKRSHRQNSLPNTRNPKRRRRGTAPSTSLILSDLPPSMRILHPHMPSSPIQVPTWRSSRPYTLSITNLQESSSASTYTQRHRPYEETEQRINLLRPGVLETLTSQMMSKQIY